jgi:GNAT superfamily N-acetyltransferase
MIELRPVTPDADLESRARPKSVVRRGRRGRGLGRLLEEAQLNWAPRARVAELVTWTQSGNEAMQSLNRSLGCIDKSKVITYHGPLQ